LGSIYEVNSCLSDVQKTWSFLENLFIGSEEVKKELPNESRQFIDIDKNMKEIMRDGNQVKNCVKFCTKDGLLKRLEKIQGELKICEKALNEFLESKRRAFPRFYFVSQDALLDILSNGNSPEKINKHMSKIFQAIEKLTLKEVPNDRPSMTEMISCVGTESVNLLEKKLIGKVEVYMQDVIDNVIDTLNGVAEGSFKAQ
jgi:dynein heavy chain, axonemal